MQACYQPVSHLYAISGKKLQSLLDVGNSISLQVSSMEQIS